MKTEEVNKLKNGLYYLHLTEAAGGTCLAVVGSTHSGRKWYACSNWVSNDRDGVTPIGFGYYWEEVESVEVITTEIPKRIGVDRGMAVGDRVSTDMGDGSIIDVESRILGEAVCVRIDRLDLIGKFQAIDHEKYGGLWLSDKIVDLIEKEVTAFMTPVD